MSIRKQPSSSVPIAQMAFPGTMAHMSSIESLPADQIKITDRSKLGPTDESPVIKASELKKSPSISDKLEATTKKNPTAAELAEMERRKNDPKTQAELARLDRELKAMDNADAAKNWKPYEPDKKVLEELTKVDSLFDFLPK